MLIWRIALYMIATFFAMRSLVSLMANHQQSFERKMRRTAAAKGDQALTTSAPETGAQEAVAA